MDIKLAVDKLKIAECEFTNKVKTIKSSIAALQLLCELDNGHDWVSEGYDPRGRGTEDYKCRICGLEKEE